MGKNLKIFANESEFETFKNSTGYTWPNVSWCRQEKSVKYTEYGNEGQIIHRPIQDSPPK